MRKQKQFPPGFSANSFSGQSANYICNISAVNLDTGPGQRLVEKK
jgi:hypothetical protein